MKYPKSVEQIYLKIKTTVQPKKLIWIYLSNFLSLKVVDKMGR